MITELDLNLLKVMDAMYVHGSVSASAASLGVSQPAVSMSLRRLRAHFGDQLFVRQSGAMVPTAVAAALREPVMRTMSMIRTDVVPALPFEPGTSSRSFVVSLSDLGDLVFLPDLVGRFRTIAPNVSIRSVAVSPAEMLRGLCDGAIDVALGHLTHLEDANFFEQTLFEQPFVCLVRADHPLIGDRLSITQYLDADHAVVSQIGRSQDVYENRVRELGHVRRILLRSPHFMSVPMLVANSDMLTVVPLAVGRIYAGVLGLRLLPVPFEVPSVELKQLWHSRSHTEPANVWLRRQIADLFLGSDPTLNPGSSFWSTILAPSR